MNWSNAPKLGLVLSLLLTACSGGSTGSPTTVSGSVIPLTSGKLDSSFPAIKSGSIQVLGRNTDEFSFSFGKETKIDKNFGVTGLPFKINDLPFGHSLVFQLTSSATDTNCITFPLSVGSSSLDLPAIPTNTRSETVTAVQAFNPAFIFNSAKTHILGSLAPVASGCAGTYQRVDVRKGGVTVLTSLNTYGPYYFNSTGTASSGGFADLECSYAIFNLEPGSYQFVVIGTSQTRQNEVLAVPGKTIVGVGVPEIQNGF